MCQILFVFQRQNNNKIELFFWPKNLIFFVPFVYLFYSKHEQKSIHLNESLSLGKWYPFGLSLLFGRNTKNELIFANVFQTLSLKFHFIYSFLWNIFFTIENLIYFYYTNERIVEQFYPVFAYFVKKKVKFVETLWNICFTIGINRSQKILNESSVLLSLG